MKSEGSFEREREKGTEGKRGGRAVGLSWWGRIPEKWRRRGKKKRKRKDFYIIKLILFYSVKIDEV